MKRRLITMLTLATLTALSGCGTMNPEAGMMLANQIQRSGEMIQSGFNQRAQVQWQPIIPAPMGYPTTYPPVILQPYHPTL